MRPDNINKTKNLIPKRIIIFLVAVILPIGNVYAGVMRPILPDEGKVSQTLQNQQSSTENQKSESKYCPAKIAWILGKC